MQDKDKNAPLYISTPIYYVNARPHLGHVYSTLYADFIARFHRNQGKKVFFITGCDQYGSKIAAAAQKQGLKPQVFVTKNTAYFLTLWKKLQVSYSHFVQTHDKLHHNFVTESFHQLWKTKAIYFGHYKGLYCVSCENFVTEEKILLINGTESCFFCRRAVTFIKENNYFLSVNQEDRTILKNNLDHWKRTSPGNNWMNQVDDFLQKAVLDFSITRANLKWGIQLPEQFHEQTVYVWFDALLSYISVLNQKEIKQIWKNPNSTVVHILGKEISKFHLIYWPLVLQKLTYQLPKRFVIHGWILENGQKMSKSIGNIVDPDKIIAQYGVNVLRIFVAFLIRPEQDIKYTDTILDDFYRSYLIYNFSNYCYRIASMLKKRPADFTDIHHLQKIFGQEQVVWELKLQRFIDQYLYHFHNFHIGKAVQTIFALLDFANQQVDTLKPWKMKNNDHFNFIFYYFLLVIKIVALFFDPIAPDLSNQLFQFLQIEGKQEFNLQLFWKKPFFINKMIKFFE